MPLGYIAMNPSKVAGVLALSALSGCVPFPSTRYYAPEVTGRVVRNGAPVANAEIRLTATFIDRVAISMTDSDGRFKLGPLSKVLLTRSLLGDPLYAYTLAINVAGKSYRGLSDGAVGYAPPELRVSCNLSEPIGQGQSLGYCSHSDLLEATQ